MLSMRTLTSSPTRSSARWAINSSTRALVLSTRCLISSSSNFPGRSTAEVPSSSLYPKTPTASSLAASKNWSRVSKSSSLSPGNPTMKLERTPASGARSLICERSERNFSLSPKRFILRSTSPLACWKERSKYGAIPVVLAMTSNNVGRTSAGCK